MVRVESVTLKYGETTILKNISFEVTAGENLVILGENGVGKSTLARALTGMLDSEGKIMLEGRAIGEIPHRERALQLNYIPPKLESFEASITLHDFVLMGRFPYKGRFEAYTPHEEQEADGLIAQLGLAGSEGKLIGQLSSGQQQLALIAQAAMQKSRVTIFDEPVANVDIKRVKQVYEVIKNSPLFATKIVITHDLNFAHRLGYPVLFLQEGGAAFYGSGDMFFSDTSLAKYFGGAVSKTEKGIVVEYV